MLCAIDIILLIIEWKMDNYTLINDEKDIS